MARIVGVALSAVTGLATGDEPVFRHIVDDAPLDVRLQPGEPATQAVQHFHETGENRYVGDAAAIAEGKQHYETWCQACHLADGSGRIGPSLIDDQYGYKRTATDVGMFEIIFAGGAGAMQPFKDRLTQDQILKLIAY
ncbi:MAG: c-type cytochrome, partial [Candidatus Rokuibacteriota bacterium]